MTKSIMFGTSSIPNGFFAHDRKLGNNKKKERSEKIEETQISALRVAAQKLGCQFTALIQFQMVLFYKVEQIKTN